MAETFDQQQQRTQANADAYVSRPLRPSAMLIIIRVTFPLLKSRPDFWAA